MLYNEESHNLYCPPNAISAVMGGICSMQRGREMHTFQCQSLKVGDQFGDLDVGGRTLIKCKGVG
jgi:hypothetical protein